MTVKRELVSDRKFIEKLNKLDLNVDFNTSQMLSQRRDIDGEYYLDDPRIESMGYTICNLDNNVILKIIDTEERAEVEFYDENCVISDYEFDELMKILNIVKAKVDELNAIHDEISKQWNKEVEQILKP